MALRALVGGRILVREIRRAGRKRFHLEGHLVIQTHDVLRALDGGAECDARQESTLREEIVLEFRERDPALGLQETVMKLWQEGVTYKEIAHRVGCGRKRLERAISLWYLQQGLPVPDGRRCRSRLPRSTKAMRLADQAKALFDKGLLMQEIASHLTCHRDLVTASIRYWYESRNQTAPDGRTRRKSLARKTSKPRTRP